MAALVEVKDICKIYNPGENEVRALDHVSVSIQEKEFVAIIGHSGSGKSTLMNMLGCLDVPTSGSYFLHGKDVSRMSDDENRRITAFKINGLTYPSTAQPIPITAREIHTPDAAFLCRHHSSSIQ